MCHSSPRWLGTDPRDARERLCSGGKACFPAKVDRWRDRADSARQERETGDVARRHSVRRGDEPSRPREYWKGSVREIDQTRRGAGQSPREGGACDGADRTNGVEGDDFSQRSEIDQTARGRPVDIRGGPVRRARTRTTSGSVRVDRLAMECVRNQRN